MKWLAALLVFAYLAYGFVKAQKLNAALKLDEERQADPDTDF